MLVQKLLKLANTYYLNKIIRYGIPVFNILSSKRIHFEIFACA